MKPRKLRRRFAVASSLSAAAMAAALVAGVALAAPASAAITIPAFPTFGAYPAWLPSGAQVSNVDHSQGSDTTLFVMQTISDLYSQAGIFPFSCQLTTSPQNQQCLLPANNSGNNPNNSQSDTVDNFAGTEELQGINDVGSSNGQGELCGTVGTPVQLSPPDYARSSKPPGVTGCTTLQGFGFAKDAVPAVDFQAINPHAYGTPTGYNTIGSFISYDYTSGATITTAFPSGGIGDVADGWLPGDPYTCGFNGGPACSGIAFTDTNSNLNAGQDGGPNRFGSDAFRLWCQHGSGFGAGLNQIMDWGNLTNLGPNLEVLNVTLNGTTTATLPAGENFPSTVLSGDAVTDLTTPGNISGGTTVSSASGGTLTLSQAAAGSGTDTLKIVTASSLLTGQGLPIGVPIRIIGVNAGSGTASTYNNFAKSGGGSGVNCGAGPTNGVGGNFNANAASGANPQTNQGQSNNLEIALENDANQIGDFANANWGMTAAADQATDIATSLYYMGNGAYLSNPNASVTSLEVNSGVVTGGLPTSFVETELDANNVGGVSIANERSNGFPTARTLFNVIRTDTVRASVGGFINWMCDGGTNSTINGQSITPQVTKGTDHINGGNFDTDLTNIINGQYDYSRLTDTTQELSATSQLGGNGVVNQNGTCEATQPISSTAGSIASGQTTVTVTGTGTSTIQAGWNVYVPAGYSLTLPLHDTVASVSGSTITLTTAPVAGTGSVLPPTLYFPGHAPVLAVHDATS